MNLTDERLRLAYADALRTRTRGDRPSCPTPEALLALVERTGGEGERLAILDHVMTCDWCRRDLDLIRASVAAAGAPIPRTWVRSPSFGLMALAAVILVVAGVRLYVASGDLESGPRFRSGAGVATRPVEWLPAGGARLVWSSATGAVSYRLEVIDAGRAVLDTTIRDTSFVLADSLARRGADVVWAVSATLDDGTTVPSLPVRLGRPRQ